MLAVIDGAVAGFASLKEGEEIDMLFVAPEFARQGVGRALIEALTKLAQARGAKRLTVEASDVAKSLFERRASPPSGAISSARAINGSPTPP